jgi:hypothetical protein
LRLRKALQLSLAGGISGISASINSNSKSTYRTLNNIPEGKSVNEQYELQQQQQEIDYNNNSFIQQDVTDDFSPSVNNNYQPTVNSQLTNQNFNHYLHQSIHRNKKTAVVATKKKHVPIYEWEEGKKSNNNNPNIAKISYLDDAQYQSTTSQGVYARVPYDAEEENYISSAIEQTNNLFIDFQLVLTKEELITLAARRRSYRADTQLYKNIASAASPLVSTPYVESQRIFQLRPNQPDKWIDSKVLLTNKKLVYPPR